MFVYIILFRIREKNMEKRNMQFIHNKYHKNRVGIREREKGIIKMALNPSQDDLFTF